MTDEKELTLEVLSDKVKKTLAIIVIIVLIAITILAFLDTVYTYHQNSDFNQMADEWWNNKEYSCPKGYVLSEDAEWCDKKIDLHTTEHVQPTKIKTTILDSYTEVCIKSHQEEKAMLAREWCYMRSDSDVTLRICNEVYGVKDIYTWNETICDAWVLCRGDCEDLKKQTDTSMKMTCAEGGSPCVVYDSDIYNDIKIAKSLGEIKPSELPDNYCSEGYYLENITENEKEVWLDFCRGVYTTTTTTTTTTNEETERLEVCQQLGCQYTLGGCFCIDSTTTIGDKIKTIIIPSSICEDGYLNVSCKWSDNRVVFGGDNLTCNIYAVCPYTTTTTTTTLPQPETVYEFVVPNGEKFPDIECHSNSETSCVSNGTHWSCKTVGYCEAV